MGKITGIVSEKGGVGKSTTACALAYLRAKRGEKVLLVDFDGQANSTLCFGVENPDTLPWTMAKLMECIIQEKELPPMEDYLLETPQGVTLLPSCRDLFVLERNLASADFRERKLWELLAPLKEQFDHILIDCMPQAGLPMLNVFMASDSILIPTQGELFSLQGLEELLRHHRILEKNTGKRVEIQGIFITMDSAHTMLSSHVKEELKEVYGGKIHLFETAIPRSVKVAEACFYHKSITEYQKDNPASVAYGKLLAELDLQESGKDSFS